MSAREPVHRTHFVARATPAEVYAVVTDFAAYPRLFPEFKQARVVSTTGNVIRVEFKAEVVIAVRYVLDLTLRCRRADRRLDLRRGRDRDRLDGRLAVHGRRATARPSTIAPRST